MGDQDKGPLLGQILLATGVITEEDLARALQQQLLRGGLLGERLIELGALVPWQLDRALRVQSRLRETAQTADPLILVIDDDPDIGVLLAEVLSGAGFRVAVSDGAEEALPGVLALDAERPSLVVLDLDLAGRDGLELLADLWGSERRGGVPVVVFSGVPDAAERVQAHGLPVSRVLTKPLGMGRLLDELEAVLAERNEPIPDPAR
jgi:CheY-like chemotaxis protein